MSTAFHEYTNKQSIETNKVESQNSVNPPDAVSGQYRDF